MKFLCLRRERQVGRKKGFRADSQRRSHYSKQRLRVEDDKGRSASRRLVFLPFPPEGRDVDAQCGRDIFELIGAGQQGQDMPAFDLFEREVAAELR